MVEILSALIWLSDGKKICEECWKEGSYWVLGEGGLICWSDGTPAKVHLNQLGSKNWKVYDDDNNFCIKIFTTKEIISELHRRQSKW